MSDHAEWNLEDHLRAGDKAVAEILAEDPTSFRRPLIIYNIAHPEELLRDRSEQSDAEAERQRHRFSAELARIPGDLEEGYICKEVGFETAEPNVIPSVDWLRVRIPQIYVACEKSGMIFLGWTFEPEEGLWTGATNGLEVFDMRPGEN